MKRIQYNIMVYNFTIILPLHHLVAQDLQALVKKLDSRVCALEKGGGSGDAKPTEAPKAAAKDDDDDDDDDFDPFADDDVSNAWSHKVSMSVQISIINSRSSLETHLD